MNERVTFFWCDARGRASRCDAQESQESEGHEARFVQSMTVDVDPARRRRRSTVVRTVILCHTASLVAHVGSGSGFTREPATNELSPSVRGLLLLPMWAVAPESPGTPDEPSRRCPGSAKR